MPDHVYDENGYFDDAEDEPLFRGRNPDRVESEGYLFGIQLAGEHRFRHREWEDIESELRRIWSQRYGDEPFDAHIQDIIKGWGDGLLGPDSEEFDAPLSGRQSHEPDMNWEVPTGMREEFSNQTEDNVILSRERLDDVTGSAAMGDLGDTVRIVSSDEMDGKIDMYYVDQMDDVSDAPDIDSKGNRGEDVAHLD